MQPKTLAGTVRIVRTLTRWSWAILCLEVAALAFRWNANPGGWLLWLNIGQAAGFVVLVALMVLRQRALRCP
jgi:hypothetical protein